MKYPTPQIDPAGSLSRRRFLPAASLLLAVTLLAPLGRGQTLPGDRDIQKDEVYPTSLLIQNGGRIYNVKNPPNSRPAAVGDGVTDDSAALISAINYIAEQARADGVGTTVSEWQKVYTIYIPDGTYLVSQSLHNTGTLIPYFAAQGNSTRGGFQ
jgi:hypothetical protein